MMLILKIMGGGDEDDVINIKKDVSHIRATLVDEEWVVWSAMLKFNGGDKVSKALVPGTRCLLKTIKWFSQAAHIIWVMRITKTQWLWLMHVNCLMKVTMHKCILNIQLMNRPGFGHSNGENGANRRWLYYKTEWLITNYTCNLWPAITYKTSLVTLKTTIRFLFMTKNLHTTNNVNITRSWNYVCISNKSINSDCIADFQLGSDRASLGVLGRGEMCGSSMVTKRLKSFLGLYISRMLRVAIVRVSGADWASDLVVTSRMFDPRNYVYFFLLKK